MTGGKRGQVPDQPLHLVPGPCPLEAGGNDRNRAGWLLGGAGAGRTLRGSVAVWIPLVLIRHPDVIVAACGNTKKPGGRRRKRISQSSGLTDSILSFVLNALSPVGPLHEVGPRVYSGVQLSQLAICRLVGQVAVSFVWLKNRPNR